MIVTARDVRLAVETVLKEQLPVVLPPLSEQWGMPLVLPRSWDRLPDFLRISDQQSPAVVTTTPGIDGEPEQRNGRSIAPWRVRVFTVVRGRTWTETADRVALMVAAMRVSLAARPGLGELQAMRAKWVDENYAELGTTAGATIGAGSVSFRYRIESDDLYVPDLPVITTTDVDLRSRT
jgi:hypothetical protein